MCVIKRAADLVYTFRFLKLLVTPFEKTDAYRLGIIDEKGKKLRKAKTAEEKDVYTPAFEIQDEAETASVDPNTCICRPGGIR